MGRKGREIVQAEIDVKGVIDDLNKAAASEWAAAYFFWVGSVVQEGFLGEEVAEYFAKQVQGELNHASMLSKRIVELGGQPVDMIGKVDSMSMFGRLAIPKDPGDAVGFVKKALEFEAKAVEYYNKLAKKYFGKDHTSYKLVSDILADEVADEDELENLIGRKKNR